MEIDEVSEAVGSLDITEKVSNKDNILFQSSLLCPFQFVRRIILKNIGSRSLLWKIAQSLGPEIFQEGVIFFTVNTFWGMLRWD